MSRCSICKKTIKSESTFFLFLGNNNIKYEICDDCQKHINIIDENINHNDIKNAIKYIYNYSRQINKKDIYNYLEQILDEHVLYLDEIEKESKASSTLAFPIICDYACPIKPPEPHHQPELPSSGFAWATIAKVLSWLILIIQIIIGVFFAIPFLSESNAFIGILIILGTFVFAFFSLSLIMVFLNIANDIKIIRRKTTK